MFLKRYWKLLGRWLLCRGRVSGQFFFFNLGIRGFSFIDHNNGAILVSHIRVVYLEHFPHQYRSITFEKKSCTHVS